MADFEFKSEKLGAPIKVGFASTIHGGDLTFVSPMLNDLPLDTPENKAKATGTVLDFSKAMDRTLGQIGDAIAMARGQIAQDIAFVGDKKVLSATYADNFHKSEDVLDQLVTSGLMSKEQRQQAQEALVAHRSGASETLATPKAPTLETSRGR